MFSWYKYLIVSLVFSHLGFWSGNLFLIAPFRDLCLLVLFPHELGLDATEFWLSKYPDELPNRISKEFILECIKLILENNRFCFNLTYYLQVKGTAIGTTFALIYATLVLAYLKYKIYKKAETEFSQTFRLY